MPPKFAVCDSTLHVFFIAEDTVVFPQQLGRRFEGEWDTWLAALAMLS
ncbi:MULTISPECIES: hypothetical protein [Sporosarcina]|nr:MULTISPECIES: hypothetical protein [Sporosarcina]